MTSKRGHTVDLYSLCQLLPFPFVFGMWLLLIFFLISMYLLSSMVIFLDMHFTYFNHIPVYLPHPSLSHHLPRLSPDTFMCDRLFLEASIFFHLLVYIPTQSVCHQYSNLLLVTEFTLGLPFLLWSTLEGGEVHRITHGFAYSWWDCLFCLPFC